MPNFADRVKESSTTTGSSDFTLAGAPTGFQTFNTAFGLNATFAYTIAQQSGAEWECGIGYMSTTTTLVRSVVTANSSGTTTQISFSAGTKDVFNSITALVETIATPLPVILGRYLR